MNIAEHKLPTPTPITDITLPKPQIVTLDNGIPVYVINSGSQEVTKIEVMVEGGVCDNDKQMTSSFVVALLREGTVKYDAETIAEKMDYYGAWQTADSMAHCTSSALFSINSQLENIIPYFSEIIFNPIFPDDKLESIKKRSKSSLKLNNEKVKYLALREFQMHYYGEEHMLGKKVTENSIQEINRDDIVAFHNKWYKPENMRIIISGIIGEGTVKLINKYFGQVKASGEPLVSHSDMPVKPVESKEIVINKEGAVQSAIRIGLPTIGRENKDYINLRILITALGGYFGSRLMQNIREKKGYTYGISGSLIGMRNNSAVQISCECDNKYTKKVIEEINNEINALKRTPMSEEELEQVKLYMTSDLLRTADTPFTVGEYYSAIFSSHIPDNYFADQVVAIQTITAEKLRAIADKYLETEKMLTVIVGDSSKF